MSDVSHSPYGGAFQLDQYSGFDHKHSMHADWTMGGKIPSWVPETDRRRLLAYLTARAYRETVARFTLADDNTELQKVWREWGDAPAMSDRTAAATLGDDITVKVVDADLRLPPEPDFPAQPFVPSDPHPVEAASYDAQMRVWEAQSVMAIEEWERRQMAQPMKRARQKWMRHWAFEENWEGKVREAETELTTPLGDSVAVFSIPHRPEGSGDLTPDALWPKMKIWEPDAYFPVFPEDDITADPEKVHFAYEYETLNNRGETQRMLRRVTYELVDVVDETTGEPIIREYPYKHENVNIRSGKTCVMSDGTWELDKFNKRTMSQLDDLSPEAAVWADSGELDDEGNPVPLRDFDLWIHEMPIVHQPSDLSYLTHFGRSIYSFYAQLLDEIALNDSDGARAADLTGQPILALEEGKLADNGTGSVTYEVGSVLEGKISKVEMADATLALMKRAEYLRRHLSAVTGLPEGVLGHVQANQMVAGVSILLTFTPYKQLIERRRLSRGPRLARHYRLLQMLSTVAGLPEFVADPELHDIEIQFGSYIPTDLSSLVDTIVALADRGLMTESVAMRLIENAGMEIGDIDAVVADLQMRRVDEAAVMVQIAGRKYAMAKTLGIDPADVDEEELEALDQQGFAVEAPDLESQEPDPEPVSPVRTM